MKIIVLLAATMLLAGCGLTQEMVRVEIPPTHVAQPSAPAVAIGSITDARTPATEMALDADIQPRNVGGMGRGDHGIAVNLENGTVADTMRDIVTGALQNSGYRVVSDVAGVPRVDVKVTKFQVLAPLQFWRAAFYNARMLADIEATVTISLPSGTRAFDVKGHGYNVYQRVVAENWQIALDKAASDFSQNLQTKVALQN